MHAGPEAGDARDEARGETSTSTGVGGHGGSVAK